MNDDCDLRIKQQNLDLLCSKYILPQIVSRFTLEICATQTDFMLKPFEEEGPEWICHMAAARAGVEAYIHTIPTVRPRLV